MEETESRRMVRPRPHLGSTTLGSTTLDSSTRDSTASTPAQYPAGLLI
jgi:hypothetical protein